MVVEYYERSDGSAPAEAFILAQPVKMRAKILRNLTLLEAMGTKLREPYSAHLKDGIYEIRSQVAGDITRVLFFFYAGDRAVLTNWFVKKSQKTPQSEIEKAVAYRADYLRRNGQHGTKHP